MYKYINKILPCSSPSIIKTQHLFSIRLSLKLLGLRRRRGRCTQSFMKTTRPRNLWPNCIHKIGGKLSWLDDGVLDWAIYNLVAARGTDSKNYLSFAFCLFSRVHATLQPALSVGRLVGRSHYFFLWFYFFDLTAPAQMTWWPQIWPLPTRTRLR